MLYLQLECSACGDNSSRLDYATLYEIWKAGYDSLSEAKKASAYGSLDVRCHCGHFEKYDSPMFKYITSILFDEFIKENKTA